MTFKSPFSPGPKLFGHILTETKFPIYSWEKKNPEARSSRKYLCLCMCARRYARSTRVMLPRFRAHFRLAQDLGQKRGAKYVPVSWLADHIHE